MLNVLRQLDLPEQERVQHGEKMVEIGLSYEETQPSGNPRPSLVPFKSFECPRRPLLGSS
jgi:hypothetical protein